MNKRYAVLRFSWDNDPQGTLEIYSIAHHGLAVLESRPEFFGY